MSPFRGVLAFQKPHYWSSQQVTNKDSHCRYFLRNSTKVVGYNILWRIAPDKWYKTYQIWGDSSNTLEFKALTVGQNTFVS